MGAASTAQTKEFFAAWWNGVQKLSRASSLMRGVVRCAKRRLR